MNIYIASTIKDFDSERKYLSTNLEKFSKASGFPILIQSFTEWVEAARIGQNPYKICKDRLEPCDYCILILGGYYGTRVKGSFNPNHLSITELEYNYAKQLPDCKIIPLIRNDSKLPQKIQSLIEGQTKKDKESYEKFFRKVKNEFLYTKFESKKELPLVAFFAIFRDFIKKINLKDNTINMFFERLENNQKILQEIIEILRKVTVKNLELKNRLLRELYENDRAVELARNYKETEYGAYLMAVIFYRRNGKIGEAERIANDLIERLWPSYISGDISTIPKLNVDEYNILCHSILEMGLIQRFKIKMDRSSFLKKALSNHKICYEMIGNENLYIMQDLKGRAIEVLASTYLYCGLINEAKSLIDRSQEYFKAFYTEKIKGTDQRLYLLNAIQKVILKDNDTEKYLNGLIELRKKDPHTLGIAVCRVWKALYFNSINKLSNAKSELLKIKSEGLNFVREYDPLLDYFWEGAETGKTYIDLFPTIDV